VHTTLPETKEMNMLNNQALLATAETRTLSAEQLIEEIAWFESRLTEIAGGECAYEKALERAYEASLNGHRERLASLQLGSNLSQNSLF